MDAMLEKKTGPRAMALRVFGKEENDAGGEPLPENPLLLIHFRDGIFARFSHRHLTAYDHGLTGIRWAKFAPGKGHVLPLCCNPSTCCLARDIT